MKHSPHALVATNVSRAPAPPAIECRTTLLAHVYRAILAIMKYDPHPRAANLQSTLHAQHIHQILTVDAEEIDRVWMA